jgi:hypothetical protein
VHIWRVANGQLAEHWMVRDDVSAMEQLGALQAARELTFIARSGVAADDRAGRSPR